MKVTIRGLGTNGNASPLYLIDGIGGDISTLNPADIENIDVLKDAASAAIYGAQAANGVVLITTKQGKEGRAKVTFDGYFGWQQVARKAQMLNAQEYMAIMDEQAINSGNAPFNWDAMTTIWRTDAEGNRIGGTWDTDWVDRMIDDNTTTQSYTIGVTGGSKTSTYAMSLGYLNQEGVIGGPEVSNYSRYNFRVNSDHKLFDGIITIGEQAAFVYKKNNGIRVGNANWNSLRGAFGVSPLYPVYNSEGGYQSTVGSSWNEEDGNPYGQMMLANQNENRAATFSGNAYAQIEPIKGLKVRTVFGTVYSSSRSRSYMPIYTLSTISSNAYTTVEQSNFEGLTLTWTNTATYDFDIKDHHFNVLVGMESTRYDGTNIWAKKADLKEGFDSWDNAWLTNANPTTLNNISATGGRMKMVFRVQSAISADLAGTGRRNT